MLNALASIVKYASTGQHKDNVRGIFVLGSPPLAARDGSTADLDRAGRDGSPTYIEFSCLRSLFSHSLRERERNSPVKNLMRETCRSPLSQHVHVNKA